MQVRRLTEEAIEKGYDLFERARRATAGDPKAGCHVETARMIPQDAMLQYLPAGDPRSEEEAVGLYRLAEELEMPRVVGMPLDEYCERMSQKLGVRIAE